MFTIQIFALHFAIALHLTLAELCNCCRDPFIVRNAQSCPSFIGFTQPAHPSRCSRSTSTTVCFCALLLLLVLFSPRGSVFVHFGSLFFGVLLWSVGSMFSRLPILQTCNVVVVLKQRLASFQHLRSSLL